VTLAEDTTPRGDGDTVPDGDATRERIEKLGGAPPVHGWDRYELLSLLGRGGMGAVYEARDRRLDRLVAIKFIHAADPYQTMRFLQEARAQARIHHPNVCKVLEASEVEGKAYIAMELVRGEPLSEAAASMTLADKAAVMRTVAEAVHAAHQLGIIHRDIKPANIMVEEAREGGGTRRFRPVLMDFGLARESGAQGLTESGAVMGTPSYMPPEQARGDTRHVDSRSDVYGLGATLYHLLSGEPPFVQGEVGNVLLKVLTEEVIPLRDRDPSIPEALDVIVGKCLNKEPHQRYATAEDLAADLDRFLNQERVVARRLSLVSRLYWRGRRNKPMAFAVVALTLSLLAFAGYGVRTRIVAARQAAIAEKRAALAQKLGQSVKDLEWIVRAAHMLPLHDVTPEKAMVRARMAEIEAEMRGFGDLAAGLDHYALGRGHLALQAWNEAHDELARAESMGVRERELDYALGRVLGEKYSRALDDARRSGDKGYFEKRKAELDRELLAPALAHLERCRGLQTVSASYVDGLVAFYQRRYDEALRKAALARTSTPWLYEASKLEGDVFMARALDARDHGKNDEASRHFQEAVARFEAALSIGRSDHEVHEALAEAWIRQEEMDMYAGRDPKPKLDKALAAADAALTAAPRESHGHTKKAFAYDFEAEYAQSHAAPREKVEALRRLQIAAGERAIALHPDDAYAEETTGNAYERLAEQALDVGKPAEPLLKEAFAHLERAIQIEPRFPWAYNDYGLALGYAGDSRRRRNEDPKAWYQKAIASIERATALDDQYAIAYNNTSVWLNELASWEAEHGENPEKVVLESVEAADRAIRINKQQALPYGNGGMALAILAAYRLDAGQDGRTEARRAIERLQAFLAIDPKYVAYQRELARAYHLLARHQRALAESPAQSIDAGLAAVDPCRRLDPTSAEHLAIEAQLRAERAAWAKHEAKPFEEELSRAEKLAREATERVPDRGELWLTLAQITLQRVEASLTGPEPLGAVDVGLGAVDKALAKSPGSSRALAVRGALLVRKAALGAEPGGEKATLARAVESLSKAFAQNPLLRRRYGASLDEAKRRSGG
jgi:eukaryotic-like serine/threonine-protein kinase